MKSILYGIAISVPMTAVIIYFALSGRQDVVLQQKSHEVQQQIQSEEFRRDFSEAWHEFDSPASIEEKGVKEEVFQARQAEREARIARLKKQQESLSGIWMPCSTSSIRTWTTCGRHCVKLSHRNPTNYSEKAPDLPGLHLISIVTNSVRYPGLDLFVVRELHPEPSLRALIVPFPGPVPAILSSCAPGWAHGA
jgi:hypothetical protein